MTPGIKCGVPGSAATERAGARLASAAGMQGCGGHFAHPPLPRELEAAGEQADALTNRRFSGWVRLLSLVLLAAFVLSSLYAMVLARSCAAAEDDAASVAEWIEGSAAPYLRSHAAESLPNVPAADVGELEIGTPVEAYAYTGGGLKATDYWAAPLRLRGGFVGTIALLYAKPDVASVVVTDSQTFATTLASLPAGAHLLIETSLGSANDLGGFFLVSADRMVTPLDPVARSYIAGSVPIASFLSIVSDLASVDAPTSAASPSPAIAGTNPVRWAFGALAALALVLVATMWYRRDLMHPAAPADTLASETSGAASAAKARAKPSNGEGRRLRWIRHHSSSSSTRRGGAQEVRVVEKPVRAAAAMPGASPAEAAPAPEAMGGGESVPASEVTRTPIAERGAPVATPAPDDQEKDL